MAQPTKKPSWAHGILYGVSSLVLGVELNLLGPTAASLARQVASTESALGPVVGLGGIGLLVGGMPAGWLLDKLPGHGVIATAQAIQAVAFCLLPHCATLPLLAAIYCCAALTFNAITTGSNALILWHYPASHGAWLNLASALFGVGCFLAPVLADIAGHAGPVDPDSGAGGGAAAADAAGPHLGPFALHGGDSCVAYYVVAAGAAACCLWTMSLPSPARPPVPEHHHDHEHEHAHALADPEQQVQKPRPSSSRRRRGKRAAAASSAPVPCRSTSSSSVLDMGGVDASGTTRALAAAGNANASASTGGIATSGSTWGSGSSANILSDGSAAGGKAATTITVADLAAAAARASGGGANVTADGILGAGAVAHLGPASDSEGEAAVRAAAAAAANRGGFGSVLSPCSPAATEAGAGAADQDSRHGKAHRHQGESLLRTAAAQLAAKGQAAANGKAAAAAHDKLHQHQHAQCQHQPHQAHEHTHQPPRKPVSPTTALFRRYLHELSMGWPVLAPVIVLLFANISTQASFGAWVTTYCRRAVGLDEAGAQRVTAVYWAAFTGTRMAGVAVAPFLHASSVLLITSPFAVAGGALAVAGLPQILFPAAASAAPAAFAAGLPMWALYVVVSLVGVGCATGFANTVSLTSDHLQLDGFTNGILSSVAGLASTLCPAAVPWLAEHTAMGYGALMVVVLCMSVLQLVSVCGALLGARWVDEWLRIEREEDERAEAEERAAAAAAAAARLAGAGGSDVDDGCGGGGGSDDLEGASRTMVTVVVVTSAQGSDLEEAGSGGAAVAAAAARRPRRAGTGASGSDSDLTTPLL